ncbi:hypothetical protein [Roseateles saccharophilus]|uniref:Uncharacterized protein n=1 Tax=Roseateles saccharophilus TaxID=304 RepID=A0A4R3UF63_ROSSA|nr:hypothetical protein [Roseateles saccharophilus]MDG0834952.1 hypothetical protein [Roseateles saccharophilus]TCU88367.1 hypothetical protein EV671_104038 [Roseateles saccharophilus]
MAMDEGSAVIAADALLAKLIQHQPGLFEIKSNHSSTGKDLGDAIASLRLRLIDMYKTQP